jgi:hypothetical protein
MHARWRPTGWSAAQRTRHPRRSVRMGLLCVTLVGTSYMACALGSKGPRSVAAVTSPPEIQTPSSPAPCPETVSAKVTVDQGHAWRPPFGLERVGAPAIARVEFSGEPGSANEYYIAAYGSTGSTEQRSLTLSRNPPRKLHFETAQAPPPSFAVAELASIPKEVAVYERCTRTSEIRELRRESVEWPSLEADAQASSVEQINPVDLGSILVPHDWLLVQRGQTVRVSIAAISRTRGLPNVRLRLGFKGATALDVPISLPASERVTKDFELTLRSKVERTVLQIGLFDGPRELWKKEIQTMVVTQPSRQPKFSAVETKLRYDAPIFMHDPDNGASGRLLNYATLWNSELKDIAVFLPNGGRFVFWRGANYIPFWASDHNTGVCYQWAENLSRPVTHRNGTVDFPEPLYDRELRYGRVHIVESTQARVHVRWTYQSTTTTYDVNGDQATEDFFFYPDGLGTRALTLTSASDAMYQLSEFIVLTPQRAFPFEVLPQHIGDVLFLNGEKKSITVPLVPHEAVISGKPYLMADNPHNVPAVYRIFAHKDDPAPAIYFSPHDTTMPFAVRPLYDQGSVVTPVYWGSHWPLGHGKITGWTINDDIYTNPGHNSLGGWVPTGWRPLYDEVPGSGQAQPMAHGEFKTLDALGRSREMTTRQWVWLIGKTDASDEKLLDWAQSFTTPPSLELQGARFNFPSYSAERRALRLRAESSSIDIKLKPVSHTMNPVFEIDDAPKELETVILDGQALSSDRFAWDGGTLWLQASIGTEGTKIQLRFRSSRDMAQR